MLGGFVCLSFLLRFFRRKGCRLVYELRIYFVCCSKALRSVSVAGKASPLHSVSEANCRQYMSYENT